LIPDTNTIKLATDFIKKALEQPSALTLFIELALQSPDVSTRQVAAVVVRRKMSDLLKNESPETVLQIKQLLLQAL